MVATDIFTNQVCHSIILNFSSHMESFKHQAEVPGNLITVHYSKSEEETATAATQKRSVFIVAANNLCT
jgi:hypothetical protein